ncbi:MAG: NADH:flavin oxidoreductase [Clostridia bacterium]|nr:NADH:flavin oxidoreductase [Clostridia bacterium]
MANLFSTLAVKGMSLRNRIVMPPMASETSTTDGFPTESTIDYYQRCARGGVGLIIVEHSYVTKSGRRTAKQVGIWSDEHIAPMASIVKAAHALGVPVCIQITHAGSAASAEVIGQPPVGPSPIPLAPGKDTPVELDVAAIHEIIAAFASAAARAKAAGFDAVELHGAHGYLLNQFLSPITNVRTDEYGGSPERRLRLPLEVVEAARRAVGPDMVLFYRLGASDGVPGGLTAEDAKFAAPRLIKAGIDVIDISGGLAGSGRDKSLGEGYFAPLSQEVKGVVNVPVMATGGITTPSFADSLIREGKADLVGIGRALLADPDWPIRAKRALTV